MPRAIQTPHNALLALGMINYNSRGASPAAHRDSLTMDSNYALLVLTRALRVKILILTALLAKESCFCIRIFVFFRALLNTIKMKAALKFALNALKDAIPVLILKFALFVIKPNMNYKMMSANVISELISIL